MYRWLDSEATLLENPNIDDFLKEIVEVCRRWNMSIGHEDSQGAFKIYKFDQDNVDWLMDAFDCITPAGEAKASEDQDSSPREEKP
jgi:hypothetical protein